MEQTKCELCGRIGCWEIEVQQDGDEKIIWWVCKCGHHIEGKETDLSQSDRG